jgi:hypothetical protein
MTKILQVKIILFFNVCIFLSICQFSEKFVYAQMETYNMKVRSISAIPDFLLNMSSEYLGEIPPGRLFRRNTQLKNDHSVFKNSYITSKNNVVVLENYT